MSKTADVLQSIWTDPWFLPLTTDAKALYLWSITTAHGNQAGLFVVARPIMELETGLAADALSDALEQLAGKVRYDDETGTLWVVGKAKRVRSKTEQIAKSIGKAVAECPCPEIAAEFVQKYGNATWLKSSMPKLSQASGEVRESRSSKPKTPNLTATSPEVAGLGLCHKEGGTGETDAPPLGFPDELVPALDPVLTVLRRIAAARGANVVTVQATAKAMMDLPRRDHLDAARDLEHWLLHGTGQSRRPKDVVGYFRNQLKQRPDVAAPAATSTGGRVDHAARLAARQLEREAERDRKLGIVR